jgi:ketosteroid isomerase-like protein
MQTTQASDVVRQVFAAYETGDRKLMEAALAEDFAFSSPPDPHLDRAQYFERCWPNHEMIQRFRFRRMLEENGEVFVTYELEKSDGSRGRNTEYFVVEDDRIKRCDVYFGPSIRTAPVAHEGGDER